MKLNGVDIAQYHLEPLDGTLNVLMKPASRKALVTNENASINGSLILHAPSSRKLAKQDMSLPFKMSTPSLVDLQREIDALDTLLTNGVFENGSYTGINELHVPLLNRTYRLVYVSMDKYSNFGLGGKATLYLKFTEPDPTQRQV